MSSEIHHLHLKFAFFLWLFFNGGWTFGESSNIKSFQIWWISETKPLVSTLRLWSSISAKWGKMLDVNIHKTNKVVLALKRKRQRLMLMRKKVITRLCEKPGSWKCTCFGPWNSTIIYQNSRTSTIPTLNMIKINRYDNRGKYLQLRKKSVNRKKNRYLFTYLENRPKTRLHIALYDLYLTSAVLVLTAEVKYSSRKIAIKTAREGEKTDDTWLS